MSKTRNQDFLRGTDGRQAKVVNLTAAVVIVVVIVAIIAVVWVRPRYEKPDGLPLSVDVPFVGPGVGVGSKVILRGVEVGEIVGLDKTGNRSVRMRLSLRPSEIRGLTDSFDVDFRPLNYFGIAAVNLVGNPGGGALVADRVLDRTSVGDYTMSTMLEQGSHTIDGTLTESMITALNKVIRYTDGLTPLIQTGIVFADRVAKAQQAFPSELLGRADDILAVLPGFSDQAIQALYALFDTKFNHRPDGSWGVDDEMMKRSGEGLDQAANSLFGKAGHLLASHGTELPPVTALVQAMTDALPHLLDGGAAVGKLGMLADRYNSAFSGTDDGKTLNLRVILDELPALAAPLAATGLPTAPQQEVPR
ncbi:Mce family protein [Nocardia sp. ET3-3]|uniref:Mce family protein n=1 Tax=Nocardia terrae TaxID=2675851 RepID=A0A7K1V2V6_9NOCA|nr:Mce family protein [Nocardia terrae]MVU80779.1 Mce family protein [Nocardia terrae]